jgi:hypothetical protein
MIKSIAGNTEIKTVSDIVKIINSVQGVKEHYTTKDGRLVIVFEEDLMLYGIAMINYHIQRFPECKNLIHPYSVFNSDTGNSIYFTLTKI